MNEYPLILFTSFLILGKMLNSDELKNEPQVVLIPNNTIPVPAPMDCNSPVFWADGQIYMFNSEGFPRRSNGTSLSQLTDTIQCQWDGPPGKTWWIEAVWKDPKTGILYGWYHHEPKNLPCAPRTAPKIGAIISQDNGTTWKDQGFVLENGYPIDTSYDNGFFVGGNGDFHVILDRGKKYFYFLFSNYGGPVSEQGIGLARSSFKNKGQPGTVFKYFNGSWKEGGLGGQVTPIFPTPTGWKGPDTFDCYWGPSIHWNTYLKQYVVVLNRTIRHGWAGDAIYIAYSDDLFHWTAPKPFYRATGEFDWYPLIIGIKKNETDTRCGQEGRLFIRNQSKYSIRFLKDGEKGL